MTDNSKSIICDAYFVMAQQFDLAQLLNQFQNMLVNHQPPHWQKTYNKVERIKQAISCNFAAVEGFVIGTCMCNGDEVLPTSCVNLFEKKGATV